MSKRKTGTSLFFRLPTCLLLAPFCMGSPAIFAQYSFDQRSEPVGLFSSSNLIREVNASVSTQSPALSLNGYAFTHWTINGVRMNGPSGQSLNQIELNLTSNVSAIAHYLEENMDSDQDGTSDWYEVRFSGNLNHSGTHDGDSDGFRMVQEKRFGLVPVIKDEVAEGGVSIRRSALTFLNFGGAKEFNIHSDPTGLVSSSSSYLETNSSITSNSLHGTTIGYVFSHWEVNGIRRADGAGIGLSQVNETLNVDKTLLAKYYPESEDNDGDDVPDWYEWHEFGNLSHNGTSDPDMDGLSLAREKQFGLSAVIEDDITEGGVSSRRSGLTFMNFGGAKKLSVSSNPNGLVASEIKYLENNSTFISDNVGGASGGYVFSHWEVNGVRQADSKGIGLSQVKETLREDTTIVAKYYHENEDSDDDHVPDWYEWHEFGNLSHDGMSDPDMDGFSLARERQFGLSTVIEDNITEGGISMRRSLQLSYSDAAFDANASLDTDGDGLSNAAELALGVDPDQPDTDGDGYPDGVEVNHGSNPNDSSSLANYPPNNLILFGSTLFENESSGSVVGEFNATDPDINATLFYSLVSGPGEAHNRFFTLDVNGTLRSNTVFDYEANGSAFSIRARVTDEHNASAEGNFTVALIDVFENNVSDPGYQSPGEDYQSPDSDYQSPGMDYQSSDFDYQTPDGNYSTPGTEDTISGSDYQSPAMDYQSSDFDYQTPDGNYSPPGTDYTSPGSDYQSPDDEIAAVVEPVISAYVPIVRTLPFEELEDGVYQFSGRILTDGGAAIQEVGFEISRSLSFRQSIRLPAELKDGEFSMIHDQFEPGTAYYYRAYARNEVGESPGVRKRLKIPALPPPYAWWREMSIGYGWAYSDWFGTFQVFEQTPWTYHLELGWIYAPDETKEGVWLWMERRNWLWTDRTAWPYLWSHDNGNWLYLQDGQGPVFYNFATERYE